MSTVNSTPAIPAITLRPGERVMAHEIHYRGRVHRLAVASCAPDGTITITPFTSELPSTPFHNGPIRLL